MDIIIGRFVVTAIVYFILSNKINGAEDSYFAGPDGQLWSSSGLFLALLEALTL